MELGLVTLVLLVLLLITLNENRETKNYRPKVSYKFSESFKLASFRAMKTQYLKSKLWKLKKIDALVEANYKCSNCSSTKNIHVHHDHGYKEIPNEPISYLRVLCQDCHKKLHEKYGYPQTLQEYYDFDTRGKQIWLTWNLK